MFRRRLRYGIQIGMQSGISILILGMVVAIASVAITARTSAES
jgi:hypothetical protein